VIATYLLTSYNLNKQHIDSLSNTILFDMDGKIRILKQAIQEPIKSQELRITIERQIAGDLIVLSTITPDIEKILGTPVEALQQVLDYERKNGLLKSSTDKNDKQVRDMAIKYLYKIESEINNASMERKELTKNLGENLRKELSAISKKDNK
jgi:hypothetical protein